MTAAIEPIQTANGIAYRVTRVFPNWASAQRGKLELDAINPRAYTPGLCAGEPFDPPESLSYPAAVRARFGDGALADAVDAKWAEFQGPPPCDGNNAGTALAQAQHEAAIDGDECDGAACLLTRGSD
jgi:hypothetical protein